MTRGNFWTIEKFALLGTDTDAVIAKRLGIPRSAVYSQRTLRGIPVRYWYKWGETELGLLRTYTDHEISKMTGRSLNDIAAKRKSLGIGP